MSELKGSAKRALTNFMKDMEKQYGEGVVRVADDIPDYTIIPTGSLSLDYALRVGGVIEGRMSEFYGAPDVGKSTVAFLMQAAYLRRHPNRTTAIIDMEHTFDRNWGRQLGLDMDRVLHLLPEHAEDVSDMVRMVVRSGVCGIITVDSVGGMASKVEFEKEAGDAVVGNVAKVVTRMMNTITPMLERHGSHLNIINQIRADIGGYKDTTTGGGWALKHGTTHKVEFRSGEWLKDKDEDGEIVQVGHIVKAKVERNKVAPKGKTAEFVLLFRDSQYGPVGIDKADEAATFADRLGMIEKSGSWFSIPEFGLTKEDKTHVNGRDALMAWFRENPEAIETVRERAIASVRGEVYTEEQV